MHTRAFTHKTHRLIQQLKDVQIEQDNNAIESLLFAFAIQCFNVRMDEEVLKRHMLIERYRTLCGLL